MLVAFLRFLSVFGTFYQKVVENWFFSHESGHTTLFGICYCVEMVRIENDSHMLEITCYVATLRVLSFFGAFAQKLDQTWYTKNDSLNLVYFAQKMAHNTLS